MYSIGLVHTVILVTVSSSMDEHTPLIHTSRTTRRRFKYRFQFIRSKGAVLVIIIDALIKWFQLYIVYTTEAMELNNNLAVLQNLSVGCTYFLFFPIIGLIADMCVGRYQMILGSMLLCLVMWIATVIVVTLFCVYTETHSVLFSTISLIVFSLSFIGTAGIKSIIIPFNIDQLMGASGDELSATIYWHTLVGIISQIVFVVLADYPIINASTNYMIHLSIGGISLVLALSILFIFNDWLDKTPQFHNPIKLIFQVLKYARKNKYPRNRSALTYWENSVPSRLDLGKDKYGGPFTVEQVEDVKTMLRLLPVLISVIAFGICNFNFDYKSFNLMERDVYTSEVPAIYLFCCVYFNTPIHIVSVLFKVYSISAEEDYLGSCVCIFDSINMCYITVDFSPSPVAVKLQITNSNNDNTTINIFNNSVLSESNFS